MLSLLLALQAASAALPVPPAPWVLREDTPSSGPARWASAAAMSADRNARLTVRCDRVAEPTVSVQLATRRPLASATAHQVSVAVDGAAPIPADWQFPGRAAVVNDPALVTALTTAMANAHEIVVTTTDGGSPVTVTVPGAAGGSAIAEVLTRCGYTLGTVPATAPTPPASGGAMGPGQ